MKQVATLFALIIALCSVVRADMIVSMKGDTTYGETIAEDDSTIILDGDYGETRASLDSVKTIILDDRKLLKKIKVGYFTGEVKLFRNGKEKPLAYGLSLLADDSIVTGEKGRIDLYLYRNDLLRLDKNSSLAIETFLLNKRSKLFSRVFNLRRGGITALVRKDVQEIRPLEVKTPGAVISAAAALIAIHYVEKGKSTIVDITNKEGNVGFRPTRMQIGEVMLKDEETAILNEIVGNITEDKIYPAAKERLMQLNEEMQKRVVLSISYPKKPLNKKWIYAGAGTLAAGGATVLYLLLNKEEPAKPDYTGVRVTW